MPPFNPIDSLKRFINTPLVPKEPVQRLQDEIDSPSLERGPLEAGFRGFGAGVLGGLRDQTSPLNLAGIAATAVPALKAFSAFRGAPGAVEAVGGAIPEVLGMGGEASSRIMPVAETLGEVNPHFTPQGGEEMFNLAKKGVQHPVDAAMSAYHRILAKGGR